VSDQHNGDRSDNTINSGRTGADRHALFTAALTSLAAAAELGRRQEAELAAVQERLSALSAGGPPEGRRLPAMPGGLAEVLYGAEVQRQCVVQIQREARKEVLGFVRPPYVANNSELQQERMAAGISYRALYEASALTQPMSPSMPVAIAIGEQARAIPHVPVKMLIVDGEHALLPLSPDQPDFTSGGLLLLHKSVLVDALVELFEDRWSRGTPLHITESGEIRPPEPSDTGEGQPGLDTQLLSLLLSGLPDKAIASQLGISLRTLQRRIKALMETTGTANRTQLAWYAAQQSWA
jgi:DNA-binding CsgD family transcriptional regulator